MLPHKRKLDMPPDFMLSAQIFSLNSKALILNERLNMSSTIFNNSLHPPSPFQNRFCDQRLRQLFSHLDNFGFEICSVADFLGTVDFLLHRRPDEVIDGVQVRTARRPAVWFDEDRAVVFEEGHCLPSCVVWSAILLEHKIRHFLPDFRQHGSQDGLAIAWTINLHSTFNEEDRCLPIEGCSK